MQKIIEAPGNDVRFIIKGATVSGKTSLLVERYKYMLEELHIPGENILVFLPGKAKLHEWNKAVLPSSCAKTWCSTFYGFILDELKTYYPLVIAKCSEIENIDIKPMFLYNEASILLISKVVQSRREKDGIFTSLVSSNDRIAADLIMNLDEAALSGIPFSDIGSRLFGALEIKDEEKRQIFCQVDALLNAYEKRCMKLGVFDFGMSVNLYMNCLLKHELYRELLLKRVRHLIIDDLQECSSAQMDLAELLLAHTDTCIFSFNTQYGSRGINRNDLNKQIETRFESHCTVEKLEGYQTYNSAALNKPSIERYPPVELRSEMLEKLGNRICRLIDSECYKPSDVVILSTYADIVTEHVIAGILEKQGYKLINISSMERMSDSVLCRSMLAFARICHPDFKLFPSKDDLVQLTRMLFKLDPVRSSILARRIYNSIPFAELPGAEWSELAGTIGEKCMSRYNYILSWIANYRGQNLQIPLGSFLQRVLMEIFLSDDVEEADIYKAKQLVDNAGRFCDAVSRFGRNTSKDFIEMASSLIRTSENVFQLDEKLYGEHVILATPSTYLACPLKSKVTVLCSVSSGNWSPRFARELTNPYVLNEVWKPGDIYSAEIEEINRKQYLEAAMMAVLGKCGEKLITFESLYSTNGFENDGILPGILDGIIVSKC